MCPRRSWLGPVDELVVLVGGIRWPFANTKYSAQGVVIQVNGMNDKTNSSTLGQRQRLLGSQDSVFVGRLHREGHGFDPVNKLVTRGSLYHFLLDGQSTGQHQGGNAGAFSSVKSRCNRSQRLRGRFPCAEFATWLRPVWTATSPARRARPIGSLRIRTSTLAHCSMSSTRFSSDAGRSSRWCALGGERHPA